MDPASQENPVSREIAERSRDLTLSKPQVTRYSRHLLVPEVGLEGQKRLQAARILIVGAGGLGSPALLYLAAAGVGTLGIAEFDTVDLSNLQRQILFDSAHVGQSKLENTAARLTAMNPDLRVEKYPFKLTYENVEKTIASFDIIVDGSDNFSTRYMLNDACVILRKPLVHGSIFRFEGQVSVFYAPHGPCYRCLFPAQPPPEQAPNCAEAGVLGVLPGQIGTLQASEAIKLALGIGESLIGRLLTVDMLTMRFEEFAIAKNPACVVCGTNPSITSIRESGEKTGLGAKEILPAELQTWRKTGKKHTLVDVRTAQEVALCRIEGSLHLPLSELEAKAATLPRDIPVVIYCKAGTRGEAAAHILTKKGFKDVVNLRGGITAWQNDVESDVLVY